MTKYAFLFGNHPTLSLAELLSFLTNHKIIFGKYQLLNDILIIDIQRSPSNIAQLHHQLGGIIKVLLIKAEFRGKIFELEKILTPEKLIKEFFAQKDKKINFGISVYSEPDPTYAELNWLNNFAYNIKRKLKDTYSIRYVEDRSMRLSSVQVERNQLIDTGAEIALIRNNDTYLVGRTLSVQDYQAYSERDWDKPSPDAKSGMLPPKLAQMLLNLTRSNRTQTIYDPFCGSGVVLQEAALLGLDVYGSDISEDAVKNTINNLDWFLKLKKLPKINLQTHIKEADATHIKWERLNTTETAIITEPYLGPPLKRILFGRDAEQISRDLGQLYYQFFVNLKKNFSSIKRIGMVFPIFKTRDGLRYVEILDEITKLGYTPKQVLPLESIKKDPSVSKRGGFLYSRPDQLVLRELFVFEKK
ncbi:MAG: DNA methyltransferase [Patescibacteria group bacterium]|jgi:tRNA G10  N-methylase Trm11